MTRPFGFLVDSTHPLWLVGFRPFFLLACLAGIVLPLVWVAIIGGVLPPPPGLLTAIQWHAHEMFYGFGWAVLGGFLLTSTKNWVGVRGYHGAVLHVLTVAWIVERAAPWLFAGAPRLVQVLAHNVFLGALCAMLTWTLARHRRTDTYRDNIFFLVVLPAFLVANNVMLDPRSFALGVSMTLGLFRMAFLIMLERTLAQFMRNTFKVALLRNPVLDTAIKLLALSLVFAQVLPAGLTSGLALTLSAALLVRFVMWKPWLALRRLDIGIMYLGYLALAVQLIFVALDLLVPPAWIGTLTVHVFTFGVMGLIIPAMLIRIMHGHTGRKVVFGRADHAVLVVMMLGFFARIISPQLYPAGYIYWLTLAALCWCFCFATLLWRYGPFLLRPRIDGQEH